MRWASHLRSQDRTCGAIVNGLRVSRRLEDTRSTCLFTAACCLSVSAISGHPALSTSKVQTISLLEYIRTSSQMPHQVFQPLVHRCSQRSGCLK
ncbi:hypothetical protein IQ238_23645 [Pleurocapsales cyanobacterium LEGE 06147]|nr:hypothetical protein [Pleurocapsales cyanobacterium LEGE 06147]